MFDVLTFHISQVQPAFKNYPGIAVKGSELGSDASIGLCPHLCDATSIDEI
jgi:hypothetical protein